MANGSSESDKNKSPLSGFIAVEEAAVPDKKYFKIGEVAHLVGVEPHVLRYWQTQFPQVRPHKSRSGHRMFRRRDVHTLLAIKQLLHVQRFTIAGARQALRAAARGEPVSLTPISAAAPASSAAAPAASAEAAPGIETANVSSAKATDPTPKTLATPESAVAPTAAVAIARSGRDEDMHRHEPHVQVEIVGLDAGLDDALSAQLAEDGTEPSVLVEATSDADAAATEAPARRPAGPGRRAGGQLGFGFQRSDRELLLKARADLRELLLLVGESPPKTMFA